MKLIAFWHNKTIQEVDIQELLGRLDLSRRSLHSVWVCEKYYESGFCYLTSVYDNERNIDPKDYEWQSKDIKTPYVYFKLKLKVDPQPFIQPLSFAKFEDILYKFLGESLGRDELLFPYQIPREEVEIGCCFQALKLLTVNKFAESTGVVFTYTFNRTECREYWTVTKTHQEALLSQEGFSSLEEAFTKFLPATEENIVQ